MFLDPADQRIISEGLVWLQRRVFDWALEMQGMAFHTAQDGCRCYGLESSRKLITTAILRSLLPETSCAALNRISPEEWTKAGLCSSCVRLAQQRDEERRKELWDALPTIFELPRWETLITNAGVLRIGRPSAKTPDAPES